MHNRDSASPVTKIRGPQSPASMTAAMVDGIERMHLPTWGWPVRYEALRGILTLVTSKFDKAIDLPRVFDNTIKKRFSQDLNVSRYFLRTPPLSYVAWLLATIQLARTFLPAQCGLSDVSNTCFVTPQTLILTLLSARPQECRDHSTSSSYSGSERPAQLAKRLQAMELYISLLLHPDGVREFRHRHRRVGRHPRGAW